MTLNDDDKRKIFEKLDDLTEKIIEIRTNQIHISAKVDKTETMTETISREGCEMGRRHDEKIVALQERPNRILGMAATIAGIVGSIAGGIVWLVRAMVSER